MDSLMEISDALAYWQKVCRKHGIKIQMSSNLYTRDLSIRLFLNSRTGSLTWTQDILCGVYLSPAREIDLDMQRLLSEFGYDEHHIDSRDG